MTTTKPFLQFAIPTWNRQREVEVCIRSIASQITPEIRGVRILVQDDCSTDQTKETIDALQREYQDIIEYRCTPERKDYSVAFRNLFNSVDAEWVWTFGDDDRLEPDTLARMLRVLKDSDLEFIHCAETGRESGTGKLYKGSMIDLCNSFGWLDMTGFITCNIARGYIWNEAAKSPRLDLYAKSSFVQSCVLLELLRDKKCAYMDVPAIATQNKDQTQECIDRWAVDKIGERYMLVGDCIEAMFEAGILKSKLRRAFFRYQNYHLWDRHITYFLNDYTTRGVVVPDAWWESQKQLAGFLEDEAFAGDLVSEIDRVRKGITVHRYMVARMCEIQDDIDEVCARRGDSCYPWGYLVPRELAK